MDERPHRTASCAALTPAEAEHSALGLVLVGLAQELTKPLVALRDGIEEVRSIVPQNDEQEPQLETIARVCDDLLRFTNGYLDLASLSMGSDRLRWETCWMSQFVEAVDEEFGPAAAARRVQWECGVDGLYAEVTTVPTRLRQVVGNLVANALKSSPAGECVRVQARCAGDDWVVFVTDHGPGIPADVATRILEPAPPRVGRPCVAGNGFGLTVARELAERLGGRLELSSAPEDGTRVGVRLPVRGPQG
jgi:signal transduction histidine kinase